MKGSCSQAFLTSWKGSGDIGYFGFLAAVEGVKGEGGYYWAFG